MVMQDIQKLEEELAEVAANAVEILAVRGLVLVTAESCTGGLLAKAITDIAGSSRVFKASYITYSDSAKAEMLGIDPHLIAAEGAVSRAVAEAMAAKALEKSSVDIALATTGIAGPGGATATKSVGLVYIALAQDDGVKVHKLQFDAASETRASIRLKTALFIFQELIRELLAK